MRETNHVTEKGLDGNVPNETEIEIVEIGVGAVQWRSRKTATERALVLAESRDGI